MNNKIKNFSLFLIILFSIYCALNIGIHWDATLHLKMGKSKLDYLFSLGEIKKDFFIGAKFFPGLSFAVTAFFTNFFPTRYEFEALHIANLIFSISGIFGIYRLSKILFNQKIAEIVFVVLIFFPIFFGHMAMNPKDTIIATSFVWINYYTIRYLIDDNYLNKTKYIVKISIFIALGCGIRIIFPATLIPFLLFIMFEIFLFKKILNKSFKKKTFFFDLIKIFVLSYSILLIFWTETHGNVLIYPFIFLLEIFSNPPIAVPANLVFGEFFLVNDTPKSFILLNLLFKTPEYIIFLYIISFFILIKENNFFTKKFKNFNYKLYYLISLMILSNIIIILSPIKPYDGLRLILYLFPFFTIIPALIIYYITINIDRFSSKILAFFILILMFNCLIKFISLTPYQYVYLNSLTGKTANNSSKFENDYLGTSIKELLSQSKFLNDEKARITFCGIEKKNLKHYLKKYKYSNVLVVRPDEKPDYIIMTNRINWAITNAKSGKTCFQSHKGKIKSKVLRNNLVLSVIKEI